MAEITPLEHRGALIQLLFGFFPTQVLQAAARLRVADELAAAGGTVTAGDLASATGTHEPSLRRLLRAMRYFELVDEPTPGAYELTDRGRLLCSDHPSSIRNLTMLFGGSETSRSWDDLAETVRTGEMAFERLFGPPFEYFASHPEQSAVFNEAMSEITRTAAPGIVGAANVERFGTVIDVGGGDGTLMSALLAAAPATRGVLFDLPAGVEDAPQRLEAAGVAERCEIVTGSFFEAGAVPSGGDAYLLKSIIHDWDDEQSVQILRNCREAIGDDDARLLLVEVPVPDPLGDDFATQMVLMGDLNMLVATGGRERTEAEFAALYEAAGFRLTSVTPCEGPTNHAVIEGVPVR